jgi:hypothetical protein
MRTICCTLILAFGIPYLPATANAEIIRYSWSGRIEKKQSSTSDPLGIGGDGVFTTIDGMPYSLSVDVDSAATATFGPPEGWEFSVAAVYLTIGGQAATVVTPGKLHFTERDDQNRNDVILTSSLVSFNGGTDILHFAIRLPGNTFSVGALLPPPFFGPTSSNTAIQSLPSSSNYVIYTSFATPFSVERLNVAPEPTSAALFCLVGLFGSVALSKRIKNRLD